MNSPLVFSGVHVAQSLVVCSVCFNIVVSVVLFLLAIVYSVFSSKASDIFKTFILYKGVHRYGDDTSSKRNG